MVQVPVALNVSELLVFFCSKWRFVVVGFCCSGGSIISLHATNPIGTICNILINLYMLNHISNRIATRENSSLLIQISLSTTAREMTKITEVSLRLYVWMCPRCVVIHEVWCQILRISGALMIGSVECHLQHHGDQKLTYQTVCLR